METDPMADRYEASKTNGVSLSTVPARKIAQPILSFLKLLESNESPLLNRLELKNGHASRIGWFAH